MIKATIFGNMGMDSELKVSKAGGTQFLTFSIASQQGEATVWVNCVVFDPKIIEYNKDKLKKGARVTAYGDLRQTTTDKGTYLNLTVKDIISVYLKEGGSTPRPSTESVRKGVKSPVRGDADESDDDIPFLN